MGDWEDPHLMGEVVVEYKTDDAVKFNVDGEEIWVPNKCIHDDSEVWESSKRGDIGNLVVRFWWAEKNGYG